MKFFWYPFIIFLFLTGCTSYYSSNACMIIPKPPKINNPSYLVEKEPDLTDWVLVLKEIRKKNKCEHRRLHEYSF